MKTALAALDEAEDDVAKSSAQENVDALQKEALQQQVTDYVSAMALWATAREFACKHHRSEPNREEAQRFFGKCDSGVQKAMGIAPGAKYDTRIKPSTWMEDVQKLFNLALRAYLAWGEQREKPRRHIMWSKPRIMDLAGLCD